MARSFFTLTNSAVVALSAGVAKTAIQLVAPANQRVAVQSVTMTFDGTNNSATPVVIKVLRQTTAGTMTGRNPLAKDSDIGTAIQSTGQENASAEPTAGNVLLIMHIHPQSGAQYPLPIPGEFMLPGGGRLGIQINAPAGVNVLCTIEGEE